MERQTSLIRLKIELIVFDCAGTVVDEGSLVYATLRRTIEKEGITVDSEEFNAWHGANKIEAIRHFVKQHHKHQREEGRKYEGNEEEWVDDDEGVDEDEAVVKRMYENFLNAICEAYFHPTSSSSGNVKLVPGVLQVLDAARKEGIRVALNTGYPRSVADRLVKQLGLDTHIDGLVVAEEVGHGRPYPYMIHHLMRQFGIMDCRRVAKVGDTVRDIEEGLNAGCGLVVGVLTGADGREALEKAGAHLVLESVAQLRVK
jgi:phosphonatase-like hydrolase